MKLNINRKNFPITINFNYLNHAVVAPLPLNVVKVLNEFYEDRAKNGSLSYKEWFQSIEENREIIGRLLNTSWENVGFFQNTSHALNTVANIIPLEKNDEILVTDLEFPSNTFPWLKLKDHDIKIKWIKSVEGKITSEMVNEAITPKTKVLALSHVCYYNGYTTNIKDISNITKDNDIIFVVDATQSLGALKIDVNKMNIDFLASNSYKWLLGPFGITILYINEAHKFKPKDIGWYSVKDIWSRQIESYELVNNARRFELGHPNFAIINGLKGAIELLLDFGLDQVENRVIKHTDRIRRYLENNNQIDLISPNTGLSGITLFKIKDKNPEDVVDYLRKHNIIVYPQSWKDGIGIKVSPHYYNTEKEIDQFLEKIDEYINS